MTTPPMPRAYFGANIFLMIAALQMVQKIKEDDILLIAKDDILGRQLQDIALTNRKRASKK